MKMWHLSASRSETMTSEVHFQQKIFDCSFSSAQRTTRHIVFYLLFDLDVSLFTTVIRFGSKRWCRDAWVGCKLLCAEWPYSCLLSSSLSSEREHLQDCLKPPSLLSSHLSRAIKHMRTAYQSTAIHRIISWGINLPWSLSLEWNKK